MTLQERKSKLEQDLSQARQQANNWATRTIAIEAQLALVVEMLGNSGEQQANEVIENGS